MMLRNDLTTTAQVTETLAKAKVKKSSVPQVVSYHKNSPQKNDVILKALEKKWKELQAIVKGDAAAIAFGSFEFVNPLISRDEAREKMKTVERQLGLVCEHFLSLDRYKHAPKPSA
jgi:hypothetical protein